MISRIARPIAFIVLLVFALHGAFAGAHELSCSQLGEVGSESNHGAHPHDSATDRHLETGAESSSQGTQPFDAATLTSCHVAAAACFLCLAAEQNGWQGPRASKVVYPAAIALGDPRVPASDFRPPIHV